VQVLLASFGRGDGANAKADPFGSRTGECRPASERRRVATGVLLGADAGRRIG
jgi:hypothetical protein